MTEEVKQVSEGKTVQQIAFERFGQISPVFNSMLTKRTTKSDLLRVIRFMANYPFVETPKTTDKKMAHLYEMIKIMQQDKTLLTIDAMGGKFMDSEGKEIPKRELVPTLVQQNSANVVEKSVSEQV